MNVFRLAVLLVCACGGPEAVGPGAEPAPGPAPEPTPPQPTTPSVPPAEIGVACAITDNALRFACHVDVEPAQPVEVVFARADGTGPERTHASDAFAAAHDVPLYMLAPETDYAVTARTLPGHAVATTAIRTLAAPPGVRSALVVTGASTVPYVGGQLPCNEPAGAGIWDTATGELVWYEILEPGKKLGVLGMVQFTPQHTVLGLVDWQRAVIEVDLLGNELLRLEDGADYDVELHHDLYRRDDLYYLLFHEGDALELDGFLVVDAAGTELARWRIADALPIPPGAEGDWTHGNTIWVDAAGDVYLSFFAQGAIVKVEGDPADPEFGVVRWVLAGRGDSGLGGDFAVDWSGVAPGGFDHQHNVHVRHDGRLMMLDNKNERALVLSLDEAALTATADAAYPAPDVTSVCIPQGTAADTLAGNAFVQCYNSPIAEYDGATGALLWQAEPTCGAGFAVIPRFYPLEGW